jgi:UDP-glucose 4-epimerase
VLDLAKAHLLGLEWLSDGGEGGVFNLGNGRGFSNLEVVRTCARIAERDVSVSIGPRRPGDPAELVASSGRAVKVLGWQPERCQLEQIVGDAWDWHRVQASG